VRVSSYTLPTSPSVASKKRGRSVCGSGPSLGRKRPRRARTTRGADRWLEYMVQRKILQVATQLRDDAVSAVPSRHHAKPQPTIRSGLAMPRCNIKKKGRSNCGSGPKSREETPEEGSNRQTEAYQCRTRLANSAPHKLQLRYPHGCFGKFAVLAPSRQTDTMRGHISPRDAHKKKPSTRNGQV